MTRTRFSWLALLLVFCAPLAFAGDDREMEAARQALEQARQHLQAAPHDYHKHREEAVNFVDRALRQVEMGLNADRAHEGSEGGAPPASGTSEEKGGKQSRREKRAEMEAKVTPAPGASASNTPQEKHKKESRREKRTAEAEAKATPVHH